MKTLYESLLNRTNIKVQKEIGKIKKIVNLPTKKDFKKTQSKFVQFIVWECPDIIRNYQNRYPNMVDKDHTGLLFKIDTQRRVVSLEVYLCKKVTPKNPEDMKFSYNFYEKRQLHGWDTYFYDGGVRAAKQGTIDIMTKLAENPDKLDIVFDYANKQWEKYKSKGYVVWGEEKSLLYDI